MARKKNHQVHIRLRLCTSVTSEDSGRKLYFRVKAGGSGEHWVEIVNSRAELAIVAIESKILDGGPLNYSGGQVWHETLMAGPALHLSQHDENSRSIDNPGPSPTSRQKILIAVKEISLDGVKLPDSQLPERNLVFSVEIR